MAGIEARNIYFIVVPLHIKELVEAILGPNLNIHTINIIVIYLSIEKVEEVILPIIGRIYSCPYIMHNSQILDRDEGGQHFICERYNIALVVPQHIVNGDVDEYGLVGRIQHDIEGQLGEERELMEEG